MSKQIHMWAFLVPCWLFCEVIKQWPDKPNIGFMRTFLLGQFLQGRVCFQIGWCRLSQNFPVFILMTEPVLQYICYCSIKNLSTSLSSENTGFTFASMGQACSLTFGWGMRYDYMPAFNDEVLEYR